MEIAMLNIYFVEQILLPLVEGVANRLLRLAGGPYRVPQRNDDLVWY
jgi:hypothetical protein